MNYEQRYKFLIFMFVHKFTQIQENWEDKDSPISEYTDLSKYSTVQQSIIIPRPGPVISQPTEGANFLDSACRNKYMK